MKIARMARFMYVFVGGVLLQPACFGKLDVVPLSVLLKESSLILLARADEVKIDRSGQGFAVLEVERVVLGRYPGRTMRINWLGREDDQAIREAGRSYLLFLRKAGDEYDAAVHGVSFWSMVRALDGTLAAEYSYPVNMVDIPEQLRSTVEPPPGQGCSTAIIPFDRFVEWLAARVAAPANNRLKPPVRGRSVGAWRLRARAAA